jgi:hypothetical protein
MIVEMRIYSLKPGRAPAVLDRIGKALPGRVKLSPLGAMWQTDTGRLDQIIHLWPFADLAERTTVRARFAELSDWPVRNDDDIVESETRIMRPAPFCPPLEPRRLGSVYEICIDTLRPHGLKRVVDAWAPRIEARAKLAPLAGAWSSEIGPLNQWTHIWAYDSFEHGAAVRRQAAADGIWPPEPDPAEFYQRRERIICHPAPWSPLN